MANISKEERARRESEAKKAEGLDTSAGMDGRIENPRLPVEPVREGAEHFTPASGAYPLGTPGHAGLLPEDDLVEAAKIKQEAHGRVEMRKVIILRDYFPPGGERLRAKENPTEADAVEVPIEDARFLEESGIAQSVDTFPFGKK